MNREPVKEDFVMFGHRADGRLVRDIDPIIALTPYIMPMRCDAQVMLDMKIPFEKLVRYIAEKSTEDRKISFMEIVIAAYVRSVSEYPELNRFIQHKRIYARTQLTVSFALLQNTGSDKIMENTVKVYFKPDDTIFEVVDRVNRIISENREVEQQNATMKVAKLLLNPVLANAVVCLGRFLDNHGLLPRYLLDASPFHTSMFITNVASIGLPAVKHHIYNFGTTSMFWSIGCPEKIVTVKDGVAVRSRVLPVGAVVDERIAEGAMFSRLYASMMKYLTDPELLETPPETVHFDEGNVYGLPLSKEEKKALKKQKK